MPPEHLSPLAAFIWRVFEALSKRPDMLRVEELSKDASILFEVHLAPEDLCWLLEHHAQTLKELRAILVRHDLEHDGHTILMLVGDQGSYQLPLSLWQSPLARDRDAGFKGIRQGI